MDSMKQSLITELIRTIQLTRKIKWEQGDDEADHVEIAFADQIRGLVDFLGEEQSYRLTYLLDQVVVYFNDLNEDGNM